MFPVEVSSDVARNHVQRADADFLVCGHSQVMLRTFQRGGQANVAAGLTRSLLAVALQERGELPAVQIAWELQAGMTSSLTR